MGFIKCDKTKKNLIFIVFWK